MKMETTFTIDGVKYTVDWDEFKRFTEWRDNLMGKKELKKHYMEKEESFSSIERSQDVFPNFVINNNTISCYIRLYDKISEKWYLTLLVDRDTDTIFAFRRLLKSYALNQLYHIYDNKFDVIDLFQGTEEERIKKSNTHLFPNQP